VALFILPAGSLHASNFLVDTEWLQKNLNNPNVRVVEVSVNPGQFERGHIPGAVNFSWHTDLVDPVRRDIANQANFQKLLRASGVNSNTTVVLYGNNNWFAAWGAWVFDVYGVKKVKLLVWWAYQMGSRKTYIVTTKNQSLSIAALRSAQDICGLRCRNYGLRLIFLKSIVLIF
jgi:3-mercaptopyruvate sulfurtransferase SseA